MLLGANLVAPVAVLGSGGSWPSWLCLFLAHCFLAYALFAPWCDWLEPAYTRFQTLDREVWLTIDDGPDGERTSQLLEGLATRGVRATFFVKGAALADQLKLGRIIVAHGHTLANHTFTHPISWFWLLGPSRLQRELEQCQGALKDIEAGGNIWFRSPLGFKNLFLSRALHGLGLHLVLWDVRSHDGVYCRPAEVIRRVRSAALSGSIILMHEGRPRSNEAILAVVDQLVEDGYRFVIPEAHQLRGAKI